MSGKRKTIWDLALQITGDGDGAKTALRQVQRNIREVQAASKQLSGDFRRFAKSAGRLGLVVAGGVAAAGVAVVGLANSFAETGDNVAKTADRLGMGIEAYQALGYAMRQSGMSAQEFDKALTTFTNTVRQGAAGNEAYKRRLAEIGLSAQSLAKMKPEQAVERLADFMNTLPSDAERTRMAIELFGRSAGPQMMAALRQGSASIRDLKQEAHSLGIVMSEEQVRQAEFYQDARTRLRESITGLRNQFIGAAIGPLTEAMGHLKRVLLEQGPAIRQLGQRFGNWLNAAVRRLPQIIAGVREFGRWVSDSVARVRDFVGGWRNLGLILGGLAVAPTLISGLRVVWSLGLFIKTALTSIVPILKGLKVGFVFIAKAALPIIAIIAAVALVIFTVKRNFDVLRQHAISSFERIKAAIAEATGGISVDWERFGEIARKVLGVIVHLLEGAVLGAIKTVMSGIANLVPVVIGAFHALWNVAQLILWPIETVIRVIVGLITGGWAGALDALGGQFERLGEIFAGVFQGLRAAGSGAITFITNLFQDGFRIIQNIADSLADRFGGVFERIRDKVEAFIGFFTRKFESVKNVFANIGSIGNVLGGARDAVSNLFNRGQSEPIPGHAKGGIFKYRHIAEIAEKGAEAVVPLNNSAQGFNIWKRAGELGGYLPADYDSSPLRDAAVQKISSGDKNAIAIEIKMTNNFSGGTSDKDTVNQLSQAGKKMADDFEARVKAALEQVMRDKRRVSYA